jgi:hypothetical protein
MCAVEKPLLIKTRQYSFGAQKRITELPIGCTCIPTYESYRNNTAEIKIPYTVIYNLQLVFFFCRILLFVFVIGR